MQKNTTNFSKKFYLGSFAIKKLNFEQTKTLFAGTCVPASPAFRNSVDKTKNIII